MAYFITPFLHIITHLKIKFLHRTGNHLFNNQGKIEVKHTISGEDRTIPINSYLRALLASMPHNKVYLFVNRDGGRIGTIRTAWGNALRKADIDDFRFHDPRHTVASRLTRAKVPESVIAMILGYKRTTITSRYINPHWEEMVEAVEELGRLWHLFVMQPNNQKDDDLTKQNKINSVVGAISEAD